MRAATVGVVFTAEGTDVEEVALGHGAFLQVHAYDATSLTDA